MCHQVRKASTSWAHWLMVQQRELVSAVETDWSGSTGSWRPHSHTPLSTELYESSFPQIYSTHHHLCGLLKLNMCMTPAVCLVLSWRRVRTQWQCWSLTVRVSVATSGGRCPSCLWWQNAAASLTQPRPCIWLKDVTGTASCWGRRRWHSHAG